MILILLPITLWLTLTICDADEQFVPDVPDRELFTPKAADIPNGSYSSK